ncbi:uncharacterized protein LOC142502662 isoform X1 [Ascaphus truei]|uniref:uncharacterized protein LOC142502662 isoform X1 n=2 Tax=Ascaphus truei TaxID=8439 RepID=UPI003F5ABE69
MKMCDSFKYALERHSHISDGSSGPFVVQTAMCRLILPLFLLSLILAPFVSAEKLTYAFTPQYDLIWDDTGSGATKDVSIWRPVMIEAGFYPLGDVAVDNHSPPHNAAVVLKDKKDGNLRPPHSFREIWRDEGSGAKKDVKIFQMIPTDGYVCLGHVAVPNYQDLPNANTYRCVRSDLLVPGFLFTIWKDNGSGAKSDVGLWRVENNPAHPIGLSSESFISVNHYGSPLETPYLLNSDNVSNSMHVSHSKDVAIVLYQTDEVINVWNDRGSGAKRDVSIWRADHCCSLGHVAVDNYMKPFGVFVKEVKPGSLAKPTSFTAVWTDKGSGADKDVSIWRPVCPIHYISLGYVAMGTHNTVPSTEDFRCVHTDHVIPGQWAWVWNDRGSGAKDDVSIWKATTTSPDGQGLNVMSAVKKHGEMDVPAYVLRSSSVQVQYNKPINSVLIYNITYQFNDKRNLKTEPLHLSARTRVENCAAPADSPPLQVVRSLMFSIQTESSWSWESSVEIGVMVQVKAGIPAIAESTVGTSLTTSFTTGSAGSHSETKDDSINAKIQAEAGYSVEYFIAGTRYTADIPWVGLMKTIYEDSSTHVENVAGKYFGVQVAEVIVSADAPINCRAQ